MEHSIQDVIIPVLSTEGQSLPSPAGHTPFMISFHKPILPPGSVVDPGKYMQ